MHPSETAGQVLLGWSMGDAAGGKDIRDLRLYTGNLEDTGRPVCFRGHSLGIVWAGCAALMTFKPPVWKEHNVQLKSGTHGLLIELCVLVWAL